MKLHDLMYDAVADVTDAPAERLAATARRKGTGRRLRNSLGIAAAAALVTGGLGLSMGSHDSETARDLIGSGSPAPSSTTATPAETAASGAPASGRSTAAGLIQALHEVTDGTISDIAGEDAPDLGAGPFTWSSLTLHTASGSATIEINLQGLGTFGCGSTELKPGETCEDVRVEELESCAGLENCIRTTLPSGDDLMEYTGPSDHPSVYNGTVRTAQLISRSRGVRVVVNESGDLLTAAQLAAVVKQPWWGARLPDSLAEAGEQLAPYTDETASSTGTSSSNPAHPASHGPGVRQAQR